MPFATDSLDDVVKLIYGLREAFAVHLHHRQEIRGTSHRDDRL